MNVGLVVQNNFPEAQEVRARKIAESLSREGHDIDVFARNTARNPHSEAVRDDPACEQLSYATVRRFSWLFPGAMHELLTAPVPVNPFWTVWLTRQFRRASIDVAVVGDIRLGIPTIAAARIVDVPVVVDLRENYPEWARVLPRESLVDHFALNPTMIGAIERLVVRLADKAWVVVEERRQELLARGVPDEKLRVVSNTPALDELEGNDDTASFDWPGFTFGYLGMLDEFRNLQIAIEALAEAVTEEPDVRLVIGGEGPYRSALERRARTLGVAERVVFAGWIDPEDAAAFRRSWDVGLIPHEPNAFTDTTVPNKLFDYMAAGLPVLATDTAPVARIVAEADCGVTVPRPATPSRFATAMCELRRSAGTAEYGTNGRAAVRDTYNWKHESEVVSASLAELTADRS